MDHFEKWYAAMQAHARGTRLHALAHLMIGEKVTLEDTGATLNSYVNDCIRLRMNTEQILMYSRTAFGTADAIRANNTNKHLLIFDLKTGVNEAKFRQLEVYAAFYCLEYGQNPFDWTIELRIYQNDEIRVLIADPGLITQIMETTKLFDGRIASMDMEAQ